MKILTKLEFSPFVEMSDREMKSTTGGSGSSGSDNDNDNLRTCPPFGSCTGQACDSRHPISGEIETGRCELRELADSGVSLCTCVIRRP